VTTEVKVEQSPPKPDAGKALNSTHLPYPALRKTSQASSKSLFFSCFLRAFRFIVCDGFSGRNGGRPVVAAMNTGLRHDVTGSGGQPISGIVPACALEGQASDLPASVKNSYFRRVSLTSLSTYNQKI